MIRLTEVNDQHREIVAYLSEVNNAEVEQKMQSWMVTRQEREGLKEMGGGSEEERMSHREETSRRTGARHESHRRRELRSLMSKM